MFTTIMYGFINEVTRQPATADIPLRRNRPGAPIRSIKPARVASQQTAKASRPEVKVPGAYRVFADSFKRAAGFN